MISPCHVMTKPHTLTSWFGSYTGDFGEPLLYTLPLCHDGEDY